MIGILTWLGILSVILCLYWGYKVPKLIFKSKKAGWIGFFIAFAIFFGDHIYKYARFGFICMTQTEDKIYDQEAYEKYLKSSNEKKTINLTEKDLDFFKELNVLVYQAKGGYYDKDNNYLYLVMKQDRDNKGFFHMIMIDLYDGKRISEYKTYIGGEGGWFFRLMDLDSGKANLPVCK